jgi:uncharacterized protein with von Willebrand factor type A (vWA) domain
MKGCLVEDYKNPVYRSLARGVLSNFLLENKKLPLAVALDSSIIHYKPWSQIVFNPHIREGWKTILENYYNTDNYKNLNNAISGDSLLSKYATIHFLNTLFKKSDELKREKALQWKDVLEKEQNPIEGLMDYIDTQVSRGDSYKAQKIIQEISQELENEAKEILQDIQTIESFSHVGIPVANLLEKPDEFREKARNKIIVHLVKFLQKLRREAPSLKQAKAPTLIGGRPLGVKKIQRFSELSRVLPIDYLDDDLLTYKVASKTVRVSESYGSIQNYVVYLDKSGSMTGDIEYVSSPTQTEHVPKISFASASALALAQSLRKIGAKMTLKLFDIEVHDPITDYVQLIDTLIKIKADSGTNISNVLEDAIKFRDEKIIVVTDGIDEVSEESIKKAKSSNLDITFIFIKTDNSLLKKNFPCIYLKEAKPEVLLQI